MNKEWFGLVEKYEIEGARAKFEKICGSLYKSIYPIDKYNVRIVEVNQGDGGIDIFIGEIGKEPIHIIQCKFFAKGFEKSQKEQITSSFKKAVISHEYKVSQWTLCLINNFDIRQNIWWSEWKAKMTEEYDLNKDFILLKDGDDLVDLLKEHDIYNSSFDKEDSIKIAEIHGKIIPSLSFDKISHSIQKASFYLANIKNYFGQNINSHIDRKETKNIIDWLKIDITYPHKNILILEGEKGYGKSVILKDLYDNIINDGFHALCIKADKYYALTLKELENKLFLDENITFKNIIKAFSKTNKKLVVIIDQLDALSQSLSSNREYIQTYNRIITELSEEKNIRVIISSRSFDLEFDAELSIYKSNNYQNIKVSLLAEEEVNKTLSIFNIQTESKEFIELLKIPNHLEIFCKLPKKENINVNTISSLKDLYDTLWKDLISSKGELLLKKLLYLIAQEMYINQKIIAKNNFQDEYYNELLYLESNQLIIEENKELQFFHQIFYDYCFFRQFVENGGILEEFLKENEQSLYVRSVVKMVIDYLREFDLKKYIKTYKKILESNKYRFHIKSLLIHTLGFIINPSKEEKNLVLNQILKHNAYEEVFMYSIHSTGWIQFLIENKKLDKYFLLKKNLKHKLVDFLTSKSSLLRDKLKKINYNSLKENNFQLVWTLFVNNINNSPLIILDYLEKIINLDNKNIFISRILININIWKEENLLDYFEKYIPYVKEVNDRDNFWYYQILQKIFAHNQNFVFEKLRPIIISVFDGEYYNNKLTHDQESTIEKLYEIAPYKTYDFLLEIYEIVIEINKSNLDYERIGSSLYSCSKFREEESILKYSNDQIEYFIIKYIESKVEDKVFFLSFFEKYKNSNSIDILKILIKALAVNVITYKNEIYELINIIFNKKGFNRDDDKSQLYLRQLIGKTFFHFDNNQKDGTIKILLSIKSPNDYHIYEDRRDKKRKFYLKNFGKKKYLFIKSIPESEILNSFILKKVYQELKRKFGDIDASKALDIGSFSSRGISPPLSENAYKKMNTQNWKSSMLKFNEEYERDWINSKGDIGEHSRAFQHEVKLNPGKFYNFINELFDDNKISITYIIAGIDGLIEAKYDAERIKVLYKRLIKIEKIVNAPISCIWQSSYLIENKIMDMEIVQYLSDIALKHPNPQKPMNPKDPLFDSLNTVRGAAIHRLISCHYNKDFAEIIFSTLEKASNDEQISVRTAIIHPIAYLNNLDIDRVLTIFLKITKDGEHEILKHSLWSAHYLNNKYHDKMSSYFDKLIQDKELHKEAKLIILSWLIDKINDKKLYTRFISSSDDAKLCAINVAEDYIISKNGEIDKKSMEILLQFLQEDKKEIIHAYSGLILRKFHVNYFKSLLPFLIKYSKSIVCQREPHYFLQFILKCCKDYPIECLPLIQNIDLSTPPNHQNGYYDKEPVQIVLSIYSKLIIDFDTNKKLIRETLGLFDKMLKYSHLRNISNNAIELIM